MSVCHTRFLHHLQHDVTISAQSFRGSGVEARLDLEVRIAAYAGQAKPQLLHPTRLEPSANHVVPLYLCMHRSLWHTVASPFQVMRLSGRRPRFLEAMKRLKSLLIPNSMSHARSTHRRRQPAPTRPRNPLTCVRAVPALSEVEVIHRESTFGHGTSSTTELRFNDCRKLLNGLNARQLLHGYGVRIRPAATLMVSPVIICASSDTRNSIVSTTSRTSPR